MKAHILNIIDGFKNERQLTNVRWKEPEHPKPQPRGNIDDSGLVYRHDGLWYFGKKGEKLFLQSFVLTVASIVLIAIIAL